MVSKVLAMAVCLVVVVVIHGAAVQETLKHDDHNDHHGHYDPYDMPSYLEHAGEWMSDHWAVNWPFFNYPQHFWPEHPTFLHQAPSHDLHCFSCNENYAACRYPFLNEELQGNYIQCNGQCVKFRNPDDNMCKSSV